MVFVVADWVGIYGKDQVILVSASASLIMQREDKYTKLSQNSCSVKMNTEV